MMWVKSFQSATIRARTKLNPRLNRNCMATIGMKRSHFHVMGSSGGMSRINANIVAYVVVCRIISRTLIAIGSVILGKLNAVTSEWLPEIALDPATTVVAVKRYMNTPMIRYATKFSMPRQVPRMMPKTRKYAAPWRIGLSTIHTRPRLTSLDSPANIELESKMMKCRNYQTCLRYVHRPGRRPTRSRSETSTFTCSAVTSRDVGATSSDVM